MMPALITKNRGFMPRLQPSQGKVITSKPQKPDQASCLMSCRADTSTSTEGPMVEVM
jgi:hypothetical protein